MTGRPDSCRYVLLTAARNEERHIGATIEAVASQEVLPARWIIVSDGSTDATDEIVARCGARYPWIRGHRRTKDDQRTDFASKVHALNQAYRALAMDDYDYVGILDADITFARDYYREILARFLENARLGIAGGFVHERQGRQFRSRPTNTKTSVAGAVQMYRRRCYEDIGGLRALPHGGEDTVSEIMARMQGWEVSSFPDVTVYHHNTGDRKRGWVRNAVRQGRMDFMIGTDPVYEIAKTVKRMAVTRPLVLAGALRLGAYVLSCASREQRPMPDDVVRFLRREQRTRLVRAMGGRT